MGIPVTLITKGASIKPVVALPSQKDLSFLAALVDDNHLHPVINSIFELGDAVKGYKAMENKHTKGKIIFRVEANRKNIS